MNFQHIWCLAPCLRTWKINCSFTRAVCTVFCAACCGPCSETCGLYFSKVYVQCSIADPVQFLPDPDLQHWYNVTIWMYGQVLLRNWFLYSKLTPSAPESLKSVCNSNLVSQPIYLQCVYIHYTGRKSNLDWAGTLSLNIHTGTDLGHFTGGSSFIVAREARRKIFGTPWHSLEPPVGGFQRILVGLNCLQLFSWNFTMKRTEEDSNRITIIIRTLVFSTVL